jgi:glutamyl/glutaminyl-tRNA synthetase
MSKRDGDTNVYQYAENGYLPEAILNFMALIGWNPGGEQEIFSREELIKQFSLEKVQKSPGIFNVEKLDWMNKEYLKKLSYEEQEEYIAKFIPDILKNLPMYNTEILHAITPIIIDRISKGSDIVEMVKNGELTYFFGKPVLDKENLFFKSSKIPKDDKYNTLATYLEKAILLLEEISQFEFTKEKIKEKLWPYAEEVGRGDLLWPIRYTLSGLDKSPDPFTLIEILGKKETIIRLSNAIQIVRK